MIARPSAPLPSWSARLVAELDAADHRAIGLVAGLTLEQLNWQVRRETWSIGQCVEHLCITNEKYLPAIADAIAGEPASPVEEIALGWFARWFIRSFIEPSPQTRRARAPKKIVPGARIELCVLDRFLATNVAARNLIQRAANHDINHIRFKNPFAPVRFTAGTGLQIVSSHERRHLLQAENVTQAAHFPR